MKLFIEIPSNIDNHTKNKLRECISHNSKNVAIDEIYQFVNTEDDFISIGNDKTTKVICEEISFKSYIDFIKNNINDGICIISSADIKFDESLNLVNNDNIEGKVLSLNKWINGNVLNDISKQDTWIFKSDLNVKNCEFKTHLEGSSGRFNYLLSEGDYIVINPCGKVVTSSENIIKRDGLIEGRKVYLKLTRDINTISPNIISI